MTTIFFVYFKKIFEGKMEIFNKKSVKSKYIVPLLQLVVVAFLFVFVFDKECVLVLKNTLDKLQICESYQAIIYNFLIPVKMLCHSPSLLTFLFVTLQLVCITTTIKFVISILEKSFVSIDGKVEEQEYSSQKYIINKNYVYLENSRLLC